MTTETTNVHPQYAENKKAWELCRDAAKPGAVKAGGSTYLRVPSNYNPADSDSVARFKAYNKGAVYYNFTGETLSGLSGMAFVKGVTVDGISGDHKWILTNIDGDGVGLEQQAKSAVRNNLQYGRAGLFVDFPETSGSLSKLSKIQQSAYATINLYDTFKIKDWATMRKGSASVLSYVVLEETIYQNKNGTTEEVTMRRTLSLDDEGYYQVVEEVGDEAAKTINPRANGSMLKYIPFYFVGSVNNDSNVDDSPAYGIASLNVAHYQNSADYEHSCYQCGQPQPVATGLDQGWVDNNMSGVSWGSGEMIVGPVGCVFDVLQVQPNVLAMGAMEYKRKEMVALGAKIMSPGDSFNTATEAAGANMSENSKLQTAMDNVEQAYNQALATLAEFEGISAPEFSINADLSALVTTTEDARLAMESWMSGLTAKQDAREVQRKVGLLERTDEEIDADVEQGIELDDD